MPVGGGLLHARDGMPDRWDVSVEQTWRVQQHQQVSRRRLARSIRQDIWRALQKVRGFVPRVLVDFSAGVVSVKAGGVLMAGRSIGLEAKIATVLENPSNRDRWTRYAGIDRA